MAPHIDESKALSFVLHGHFYQPPRENPWLEAIEREPGALPFSNWNMRIADECYRCNGFARIFNEQGHVSQILNNYLYLSFNFGPTLLSWLEIHMPRTYARIIEADRQSIPLRGGHGNAIAQAYGHAILPLCNDRDRLTQIRWGKRDFIHRFGRPAEAMWLPETAINRATVEDLISEGLKFIILSPRQALRVRPFGSGVWSDVANEKIDPRMPYRCFSLYDPGRFLDIFFYDGPVAHAISFEEALHSSQKLVDKYGDAVERGRSGPQLIHAAVDGETFGHHVPHAERALSWAFQVEIPKRGFHITNYGEYLERHPPTHEVELNFGPQGEGTSWSCVHGVGRWYRDCSCHASAPEGWNQAWRTPLRQAIHLVRDEAALLFAELGSDVLRDPWVSRDAYIELLLDPSPRNKEAFFERYASLGGRTAQRVQVLKLLEMQRYSLLAQTSCGWFFNDISGLESTQMLKYAARTVQLYEELSGRTLERRLLEVLAEARSNLAHLGNGADLYRQAVLKAAVGTDRLVAQYAIIDMFRNFPDDMQYYRYQIKRLESQRLSNGPVSVNVGRLQVEFIRTGESTDITYALIHFGGHDFHCAVRPFAGIQEFRRFVDELQTIFSHATITELLRVVDAHFGKNYFGLPNLLQEEREEVLDALFGHLTERFAEMYSRLYWDNYRAVNALIDTGLKLPAEFRMAAEYVLSRKLNEEVKKQNGSREADRYTYVLEIVEEAERRNYTLDKAESEQIFGEMLNQSIHALVEKPGLPSCREVLELLELADSLKISLPLDAGQDMLFKLIQNKGNELFASFEDENHLQSFKVSFRKLLEKLQVSPSLIP